MDHLTFAQLLGSYGEFVGAIAVVATILYLATQVRMSNKFEAANHHDVHMDRIRERIMAIAQDGDLARIVQMSARGEALEGIELVRSQAFASHRIIVQRDAWQRATVLGKMPGLPEPDYYLDILVQEMKNDQGLLSEWRRISPHMSIAWRKEFTDYINGRLAE